ncbi:serine/threonine protein kinase [Actinoalloteichus hymeniacidonis]|nr:serine/threonine-protein kinase [Actinoalloteichus hymeniacidonis]MBB5906327.1 serine/threonine protein kinase [Actinoalloteichus hymeniacidonis]
MTYNVEVWSRWEKVSVSTRKTPRSDHGRLIAGRYRLHQLIGQGAMGTVWAAYDEFLHRQVAVKEVLLPPGIPQAEADEMRERTMREARANAILSHPNVVTLFDVARQDGEPFVVMELVPSNSLGEVLDRHGPLDQAQAAWVADSVAAALEAAHRAGITHRDVKPRNVLVGRDGQIKLTDFGIARNVAENTLTATGLMLGTPSYIAPEVASGGAVTTSADLWALGATLYAAVEGHAPYSADADPVATVFQVVHGAVPQPTCGGPLAPLISGLMVKDVALRLPLSEVRQRLQPLLPESPASISALLEIDEIAGETTTDRSPDSTDRPGFRERAPWETGRGGHSGRAAQDDTAESETVVIRRLDNTHPAGDAGADAPLAHDPGPLPFGTARPESVPPPPSGVPRTNTGARRRTRGRGSRLATLLLAVPLFLGAAAGGFAIARTVGGEAILPSTTQEHRTDGAEDFSGELQYQQRTGTATDSDPSQGISGRYSLDIPRGWVAFHEQGRAELGPDIRHRYLAEDGSRMISVQRLIDFYPDGRVADYIDTLSQPWSSSGELLMLGATTSPAPPGGIEPDQSISYRRVEVGLTSNADQREIRRSTFANLLPRGDDLWVVSVTVPTETEGAGSRIYEHVSESFQVR